MFPWGNTFKVKGEHQCNTWQGQFPHNDIPEDGHAGPAPVWTFKQNDFELHNMVGNVWEWTADWWSTRHSREFQENPVSKILVNQTIFGLMDVYLEINRFSTFATMPLYNSLQKFGCPENKVRKPLNLCNMYDRHWAFYWGEPERAPLLCG